METAYHEAGHTVMAYVLGKPISYVDIAPLDDDPPGIRYLPEPDIDTDNLDDGARTLVMREIKIAWAGIVAQNRLTGRMDNIVVVLTTERRRSNGQGTWQRRMRCCPSPSGCGRKCKSSSKRPTTGGPSSTWQMS